MANHKKVRGPKARGMKGLFKGYRIAGNSAERQRPGIRRQDGKGRDGWD